MPAAAPSPQSTRFAIQKARGKGWTTLEVGEELPAAEARFALMVRTNPRAYFRLIELELNPDSAYGGMEFNWKLLKLHDPRNPPGAAGRKPARRRHRPREKVPLPLRFYAGVLLTGAAVGLLLYLVWGRGGF